MCRYINSVLRENNSEVKIRKEKNMAENKKNTNLNQNLGKGKFNADPSEMRKAPGRSGAVPGVNTPNIEAPPFNPPVPNRAWTAMRMGKDIEELTEEEKRELYLGRDELY